MPPDLGSCRPSSSFCFPPVNLAPSYGWLHIITSMGVKEQVNLFTFTSAVPSRKAHSLPRQVLFVGGEVDKHVTTSTSPTFLYHFPPVKLAPSFGWLHLIASMGVNKRVFFTTSPLALGGNAQLGAVSPPVRPAPHRCEFLLAWGVDELVYNPSKSTSFRWQRSGFSSIPPQ